MSAVAFTRVTKRFPGVVALDDVTFEIADGSCHALIGENGAGKSTLGKILAGIYVADAGVLALDGAPVQPHTPLAARKLGIAMVHQELAFCPNLSVAENLCLGDLPRRAGWVDREAMAERSRAMLRDLGAELDVSRLIGELSTGQEQIVQIASAVGSGARVLIMDEPTSSLTAHESDQLFRLLGELKKRRITIIYISHRMEEIFRLCDTVSVLRDGRHVSTEPVAGTNQERIIQQMIGRKFVRHEPRHLAVALGAERLRTDRLTSPGRFRDISLTLRAGEVLGVAGLVGAGRSELATAIFGLDPAVTGAIHASGRQLCPRSIAEALKAGIGLLPEDRKRLALVLSMNCRENASLASLDRLTAAGFIRRGKEYALVCGYLEQLAVKTPSPDAPIDGLSGGNQQKIALAKWLARECQILIVDEPTRGIDVGAKAEIHRILDELACAGRAILLISSELPELLSLSRRIVVMREGTIAGELARAEFSEEALLRLMAGVE